MSTHRVIQPERGRPIRMWTEGVSVEAEAEQQLRRIAEMPFIHKWVAVMPDVHLGKGATVGSVIPTKGAIIPAAVGVDIGCGMVAARTTLNARTLPDSLAEARSAIEAAVPHGRTANGDPANDRGAWGDRAPASVQGAWAELAPRFDAIAEKHPKVRRGPDFQHLATLGTGNHFIEVCLDEADQVWVMLHSGSRGLGNRIGSYFIERAKEEMRRWFISLPDQDLAYLAEGSALFDDYVAALSFAQDFAQANRALMMAAVLAALRAVLPAFEVEGTVVNCHHNYVAKEHHYGENVWVTRKGAVRAREGDLGIIPGSMGARSYLVRGKGCAESFSSSSHGAGRAMSRAEARRRFSLADHASATAGIECRKDEDVIDETPAAYKPIDQVMAAQADLVEIVHTLRQVVCVKG
ncbi:MAG: RtcB family protein [Deltaproteobacteria bacterium]|nr:RtcB family protein [Deltaproteobacteria bacterium]